MELHYMYLLHPRRGFLKIRKQDNIHVYTLYESYFGERELIHRDGPDIPGKADKVSYNFLSIKSILQNNR